jgi:hypothetical protein
MKSVWFGIYNNTQCVQIVYQQLGVSRERNKIRCNNIALSSKLCNNIVTRENTPLVRREPKILYRKN